MGKMDSKNYYKADKKTKRTMLKKTLISQLVYINVKHLTSSTAKMVYHLKSTGVHLGLITKLIESDIFLSGF